jgi:SAM-dependent methyltransferase
VSAHFFVADANTIELPPERYDVVFSVMAMHHFEQLEYLLEQVDRSLKPNGFLILNEFVGASRFQWPQHQRELATSVLHLLEPSRRQLRDGPIREAISAPPLEAMLQSDPFEAIRSAEIKTQVAKRFNIVRCLGYGGSILHLALHDIVHNFDETRETDREVLATFCRLEELLLRLGLIESDFTVLVARKRATLAQPEQERNALVEEVRLLRNELGRQNADLERLRQHLKDVESGRILRALGWFHELRRQTVSISTAIRPSGTRPVGQRGDPPVG